MTEAQRLAEIEKRNSVLSQEAESDSVGEGEGFGLDMTPGHKARAQEEVCLLSGSRVWGLGFRPIRMCVSNQGFERYRFGFRVWGLGFGVWGLGFGADRQVCIVERSGRCVDGGSIACGIVCLSYPRTLISCHTGRGARAKNHWWFQVYRHC